MKKASLNAIVVNRLLIVGTVLVGVGSLYGCFALQQFLSDRALETNHAKIDVEFGRNELQSMSTLETYLKEHASEVASAASVVADSNEYKYQDQIVKDLNTFASQAGVKVLGFTFPAVTTPPKKGPAGVTLKTIRATITLQNPVHYTSFLTFLKLIERNLTKMQITDITVTPVQNDPSSVNNPTIDLEVYVNNGKV